MRIRPPSPPRRAVAALATALLALAMACTPGGSDDSKSSSSGPVTLKLPANAVKGGKNATEATWLQDWVIPNYLVWNWLGLTNTQVPLWAHNLFGSAFYIFLLRQFFLALPRELFEAARVDGASYLQLFRKIALPLTKPALIVTFVFEFRASWTDLMRPLIYLRDNSLFTLPRGLKVILDQFGQGGEGPWEVVLAASVIATVPMLIIFFLGQRYFVEGIATTGRKG